MILRWNRRQSADSHAYEGDSFRTYLQARRVGVGTHDREAITRGVLATYSEGHDRRAVAGEEVFAIALNRTAVPVVAFLDLLEACLHPRR